ncbi:putative quinol monooxygenase [Peribacillus kribbensis]|uniref:putative quinol monooxygenase n=1 Tax=Peribacillus kribbensis TaxID=356658 RepID=UPI00040E5016|nr:putative quinol monooxygenase [Peribacillus kribbensis]
MITINAYMQVKPELREEFLEMAEKLIASSRAEEGNNKYELYVDPKAPNSFVMVEEWKDNDAVADHNKSEHFTSFMKAAPEYFEVPLKADLYESKKL